MRVPRAFAWAAAAALLVLAAPAVHAGDSHSVQQPQPEPVTHSENCDPSKWKLPVDAKYDTKGKIDPHKLNVHLISHSHDDPGWLVGVDQYYMERVQYILDTVIEQLLENPDRQFMFVEQSFFQRWWHQQSHQVKHTVKKLVKEGRLDLSVNGGWCMHDEATPHYSAMVDQTAYGHRLLKEEFNVTPRIGWQIDPFGHSSTQGSLLSTGVGFDALYFARIDYQDNAQRKSNKDLEFIWRPSKSRGKNSQVFTGQIIDHYGAPGKYNYGNINNEIQDDPELHDFDVCSQVDEFVKIALDRGAHTKGNHIFIPMGDDFQFDNARHWFKNMDKLMHYVNQDNRVNVLYSNLSYYTDLKLAEDLTWSVKLDDFFPYSSGKHEYWSGFFTSRPALKRFARVSNVVLQQVRQLDALYQSHHSARLEKLQRAVGLTQHHDGLSGTEKQSVADDYALRMNGGIIEAEKEFNEVFFVIGEKEKYQFCLLANVSVCEVSTSNEKFEVLVHNSLPRKSVHTVSIPVNYHAFDVQVISELDPLSDARFMVQKKSAKSGRSASFASSDVTVDAVTLENDLVRVKIDKNTGSIVSITNKAKNIELPLNSSVLYYQAFQGDNEQRSGAYIFRPDSKTVYSVAKADEVTLVDLQLSGVSGSASRVAFKIGKWVTLEYRVNDADEFVEIEWTVGSIPIKDNKGKEVIIRFDSQSTIKSAKTLFTDSNGLEFVTRVRNHRDTWNLTLHDDQEFVAANYFPITTGAYIKDDKYQFNIVTDRAQGAASLEDGQIEVMVHRRLLADDGKGVGEHLNETESVYDAVAKKQVTKGLTVRGNFFINVDSATEGIRSMRTKAEKQFFTPLVALRKPVPSEEVEGKIPWLKINEFPENVGLTTLQELSKDSIMVRLTHLYSVEEHASLSKSVKVDFSKLFAVKNAVVSEVTELTLTGVSPLTGKTLATEWKTTEPENYEQLSMPSFELKGTEVELQAMEVRSFRVVFKKSSEKQASAPETAADMHDYLRHVKEEAFLKIAETESDLAQLEQVMAFE
uniref:Alpha-mannosidase n=1 Tax=Globisporangium ultimum (strain ATCC 200006 / CBS 805.95 / DAOM BR144) TaxID=431595 RepID=K3X179_GLOUD